MERVVERSYGECCAANFKINDASKPTFSPQMKCLLIEMSFKAYFRRVQWFVLKTVVPRRHRIITNTPYPHISHALFRSSK